MESSRHPQSPEEDVADKNRIERQSLRALHTLCSLGDASFALHLERTADLARSLAEAAGLDKRTAERVWFGGLVHDIGKAGIDPMVLGKTDPLDHGETEMVRGHTAFGQGVLARVDSDLYRTAAEVALSHHERWDGGGYPEGLAGEDIPLSARIVAIADVFDCITSGRPYSPARSFAEAEEELRLNAGSQFDPHLVELFLSKVLPHVPAD